MFKKHTFEDGEEGYELSALGVLVFTFITWKDENNDKASNLMMKFCQLVATQSHSGSAKSIHRKLHVMNKDNGVLWIKDAYKKYDISDETIISWIKG
jgi:hypothetical protein